MVNSGMDADTGANTAARTIDICTEFVGSPGQPDAVAKAISTASPAVCRGVGTPEWDRIIREAQLSVPANRSDDRLRHRSALCTERLGRK